MVMAFGSSCCSAALTALKPTAATDKAISVAIRVTGFMGLLLGSPLGARRQRASSARMVAQRPRRGKTAGLNVLRAFDEVASSHGRAAPSPRLPSGRYARLRRAMERAGVIGARLSCGRAAATPSPLVGE